MGGTPGAPPITRINHTPMARIISISSGKGGVGKTSISVNLALQLARLGQRVCLFDVDLGLANVNILLGLQPEHTLADVIRDGVPLEDILVRDQGGVDIIPGSSGIKMMADLEPDQMQDLVSAFAALDEYDWILLDTSSGISRNVISFSLAAPEVLLVVNTEPTSLTDAYALLKILFHNGYEGSVWVLVNQSRSLAAGEQTYDKFRKAVRLYLERDIPLLGVVPQDAGIPQAVTAQRALAQLNPDAPAARRLHQLAVKLMQLPVEGEGPHTLEGYWAAYLKCLRSGTSQRRTGDDTERQAGSGTPAAAARDTPVQGSDVEQLRDELMPMLSGLLESQRAMHEELCRIREHLDAGMRLAPEDTAVLERIVARVNAPEPVLVLPAARKARPSAVMDPSDGDCPRPEALKQVLKPYKVICERVGTEQEPVDLFSFTRHSGQRLLCGYHAAEDEPVPDSESTRASRS